jgi:hypothetical protein
LYDSRMGRGWMLTLVLVLGLASISGAASPDDRRERFKELARQYAEAPDAGAEALRTELLWVIDSEIIENLRSGRPFASAAFLQERLDAFSDEWGGASFRIVQPEREAAQPLTFALGVLTRAEPSGSVRIYGSREGEVALLAAVGHDGVPDVHAWPATRDGAFQVLTSWLGSPTGRGSRPLYLELWQRGGSAGVTRVWSSSDAFPEGLWAKAHSIGDGRLLVRYEVHYPGWKSGCDLETEQEDVYRAPPTGRGLMLLRRRVVNGWHRELHAAVTGFFVAVRAGDAKRLAVLVPDPLLRARLPHELGPDPACDQRVSDAPPTIVVAATAEQDRHLAPWSLWWRRGPQGWRLTAASPVLQ